MAKLGGNKNSGYNSIEDLALNRFTKEVQRLVESKEKTGIHEVCRENHAGTFRASISI